MSDIQLVLSIGGFVVALTGLVGGIIVRDRQVHKTIDDKVGQVNDRVNRLRDDMVRHSDLKAHTDRIEGMLSNVQNQLNMLIQKLLKE